MSFLPRWWIPLGILSLGTACGPEEALPRTPTDGSSLTGCDPGLVGEQFFQFGTTGVDRAVAASVDGAGNLFLTGNTTGLFGEPQEQAGGQDLFVAKLNGALEFQWAHQLGSPQDDYARDLATSRDGTSTYVVGYTNGALPGERNIGGADLFTSRYDASGNRSWIFQQGTVGEEYALSAAVRPDDRLTVVGAAQQVSGFYDFDVIFEELDVNKQLSYLDDFGSVDSANDRAEGVAVRGDGMTWIVGSTQGELERGINSRGSTDVFIRQLDGNYFHQWTKEFGTPDIDAALQVVPDGSDRIYVLALSYSNLETGAAENDGIPNAFLLRVRTSDGDVRWVKRIGPANQLSLATGLAVDASGNAYVAGWTSGALDSSVTHKGGMDAYVVKYDRYGNRMKSWQWGTPTDDEVRDVVVTGSGQALAVGTTSGAISPGSVNQGNQDVFVVKFATSP